jgi:hypothetical protein
MRMGVCKLCLLTKPLMLSHLIPAGCYAYCESELVSPLRVGNGVIFTTDRQTKDYLLCADCEEILNKGGEAWMIPKFTTIKHSFPFFTMLTNDPPFAEEGGAALYNAGANPLIDVQKVTHFAMGIFWRASVHSWEKGGVEPMIDLGPYSESIRTWLRGDTVFPEHVYLSISVSRPPHARVNMAAPFAASRKEWRTFSMYILGVFYGLCVGRLTDPIFKLISFFPAEGHTVMVSDDVTANVNQQFIDNYLISRKTASYLRAVAKVDAAKRGK